MKLEKGLVIIRKDRSKGLQNVDWPFDYLFFDKDEILKYFYKAFSETKTAGFDNDWWTEEWRIIERESIKDIIERVKSAMYSKKQEVVCINIIDMEKILKEIENVTK